MSEPAGGAAANAVAVAFDLDGTLLELPVDIARVKQDIGVLLAALGDTGPPSPILEAVARAATAAGPAAASIRTAAFAIIDRGEVAAARRASIRPGAASLVEHLRQRGVAIAIVTDNGRACVAPALAAAGLPPLRVLVARDDVAVAKPAPDGVIAAAGALLPRGGRLVWVGDSPRDVAAGLAARPLLAAREVALTIIAVRGGRGKDADLDAAGADRVVADLLELGGTLAAELPPPVG